MLRFSGPYFYFGPTRPRSFGLYTFSYRAKDELFRQRVPQYGVAPRFELVDVRLDFDSPFPMRAMIKRAIGSIFNMTH